MTAFMEQYHPAATPSERDKATFRRNWDVTTDPHISQYPPKSIQVLFLPV